MSFNHQQKLEIDSPQFLWVDGNLHLDPKNKTVFNKCLGIKL